MTTERYAISSTGRSTSLSTERGCSIAPASAFTVTSTLAATLTDTQVTVGNEQCNRRGCTTTGRGESSSAQAGRAGGSSSTASGT